MDIENQILIEENTTLTQRVNKLEKDISLYKRKFDLGIEFIKSFTHLVPNAVVKFEEELKRIENKENNGENPEQREENT